MVSAVGRIRVLHKQLPEPVDKRLSRAVSSAVLLYAG